MLHFLHLPYPRTYPVSLDRLLQNITANADLQSKVRDTHKVRENLREFLDVCQTSGAGDPSRIADLAITYARHVCSLLAVYQTYRTAPSQNWCWKGVLSEIRGWVMTTTEFTSSSVYFEYVCVLQLYAFALMNEGWQLVSLDAKTDVTANIKKAIGLFRTAAGVFQYIVACPLSWWHSTETLGAETSASANRSLVDLCKGQAQEILTWAGIQKRLNENNVAKQAKAAWVHYRTALSEINQSNIAVHMPELNAFLQRKEAYWNAMTFKLAAVGAFRDQSPGLACAYLRLALTNIGTNTTIDSVLIDEIRDLNEKYTRFNMSVHIQPVPESPQEPEPVFQCEAIPFAIEPIYEVV